MPCLQSIIRKLLFLNIIIVLCRVVATEVDNFAHAKITAQAQTYIAYAAKGRRLAGRTPYQLFQNRMALLTTYAAKPQKLQVDGGVICHHDQKRQLNNFKIFDR